MSATALLQKAAQMGAGASSGSFLRGFGLSTSSSPPQPQDSSATLQWNNNHHSQPKRDASGGAASTVAAGLGLEGASTVLLTDLMMGPPLPFGNHHQPMTRDLLGLGIGANGGGGGASSAGLSALLNSFGGGGGTFATYARGGESSWESAQERKPNGAKGPALL